MNIVIAKPTTLKSPLSADASSIFLKELVRRDTGDPLAMEDFGDFGSIVVKQGDTHETIKFSGLTQNEDGSATLTVAPSGRDIDSVPPYDGYDTGKDFSASADVVVTNDALIMSVFAKLSNANVWELLQTFKTFPKKQGDLITANLDEFITYQQLIQAGLGSLIVDQVCIAGIAGVALTPGQLCYYREADQRWYLASAATTDQQQNTQDNTVIVGEANATTKKNQIAQSFVAGQNILNGVVLNKQADTGSFTGTVTVDLLADASGAPTGSPLATVTFNNAAWLALPVGSFTASFVSAYLATIGSTYWIRVSSSTADNSNHPNFGIALSGGYANGVLKSWNTSDGWQAVGSADLTFQILSTQTVQGVRLAFVEKAAAAGASVNLLRAGVEKNQTGLTPGAKYYASNTPGTISTVPGTTEAYIGNADSAATKLIVDFRFEDVPTAAQKAALAGTSGTTPSGSNKFVDNADPRLTPSTFIKSGLVAGSAITGVQPVYAQCAQIGFDTSVGAGLSGLNPTASITIGNNQNRVLVIFTHFQQNITALSVGGVSGTQVDGGTGGWKSWVVVNPPTGAQTVTCSASSGAGEIVIMSYYNCIQTGVPDNHATTNNLTPVAYGTISVTANTATSGVGGSTPSFWTPSGGMNNHVTLSPVGTEGSAYYMIQAGDSGIVGTPAAQTPSTSANVGTLGSYLMVSLAPVISSVVTIAPTSASIAATSSPFIGFSTASIAQGSSGSVVVAGIVTGLSGLQTGATYYLGNTAGSLQITPGTVNRKVGVALSPTTLLITYAW